MAVTLQGTIAGVSRTINFETDLGQEPNELSRGGRKDIENWKMNWGEPITGYIDDYGITDLAFRIGGIIKKTTEADLRLAVSKLQQMSYSSNGVVLTVPVLSRETAATTGVPAAGDWATPANGTYIGLMQTPNIRLIGGEGYRATYSFTYNVAQEVSRW